MDILAHRGYWENINEKNSYSAITRAFGSGFGIETDIRDLDSSLCISHNPPDKNSWPLEKLFEYYSNNNLTFFLALNIKSDGLQSELVELLTKYNISNYGLFDSSVPEMVMNQKYGLRFLTRLSDIEKNMVLEEDSIGIWLDAFYDDSWITSELIYKLLSREKILILVSPELHGRDYHDFWNMLKSNNLNKHNNLMLCTDNPKEAREFFYE